MIPKSSTFHLAQVNIAETVARLEEPAMSDMVARINEINALAESSPGFVWRFKSPPGTDWLFPFSGYFPTFDPHRIFFNMSVWKSVEELHQFTFQTAHVELFRDKQQWQQWLLLSKRPSLALWWIPSDCVPTVDEGRRRLSFLETRGATADAFTFQERFEPPV